MEPQRDLHLWSADDEDLLAVVKILRKDERRLVNRDREIDLEDVGLEIERRECKIRVRFRDIRRRDRRRREQVRTNLSSSILRGDGISDSVRVLLLSILRQRGEVGERSKVVVLDPKDMSNCPAEELELDPSRLRTKKRTEKHKNDQFLEVASFSSLFC